MHRSAGLSVLTVAARDPGGSLPDSLVGRSYVPRRLVSIRHRKVRLRMAADFRVSLRGARHSSSNESVLAFDRRVRPRRLLGRRIAARDPSGIGPPAFSANSKFTDTQPERESKMTPDELNTIAVELKRLVKELNLSDSQREQLRTFLTEKYEQLQEYKKQNPNISREDIAQYIAKNRAAGREKIEKFLTPEQLKIWDGEVAKAKDFLSQRAASA